MSRIGLEKCKIRSTLEVLLHGGIKVASNFKQHNVNRWLQESCSENQKLFSVRVILMPETKQVANNSQTNAWKMMIEKHFPWAANQNA